MKRLQGLIAATLVTVIIGLGMVAIGVNAASNADSVPVSDSPAQVSATTSQVVNVSNTAADQAQIDQLQATVKQYQAREKQYQDREKQYQTELAKVTQQMNDATAQAEQLKQILVALQQRGVINISEDGRISIPRG
jgi:peptidoglycan hydrolase CwlO-like protein